MTTETKAPPFTSPQNITVGLARVILGPYSFGLESVYVFHLPGGRHTLDRDAAHACAVRMNTLMGGVQTVREVAT